MNIKLYFTVAFIVGILIGSYMLGSGVDHPVSAAEVPQSEESAASLTATPRNQTVDNVISILTYVLILSSGAILWKKVNEHKPRYRVSEPVNWRPI